MTAVNGLAGYLLSRMSASWETTSSIADRASVTTQQAGTCLARLTKLGLVSKGSVDSNGQRMWQRVEVKPTIGVGDRVRIVGDDRTKKELVGAIGRVRIATPTMCTLLLDGSGKTIACRLSSLERLPDADPVPWDPPKPLAARCRAPIGMHRMPCARRAGHDGTHDPCFGEHDEDQAEVNAAMRVDKPRPIAWAQQTRPEIPWHLKTPMQQRGVAP